MEQIQGIYREGRVELENTVGWPEGSPVTVLYLPRTSGLIREGDTPSVIIAGFGLAGRFVADVFRRHAIPFVVVERNPRTVETQRSLGASILAGDIRDENILKQAGIESATVLALTVPDEKAVLEATCIARRLNPAIYIVARTQYASSGLQAARLGADEVVQAEYAVAMQFYQSFLRKLKDAGANEVPPERQK